MPRILETRKLPQRSWWPSLRPFWWNHTPRALDWGSFFCCFHDIVLVAQLSDSVTPWTVACQGPLSMEFFRQEYWTGQLLPSPDFPNLGIEPESLASRALADRFFTIWATMEALLEITKLLSIYRNQTQVFAWHGCDPCPWTWFMVLLGEPLSQWVTIGLFSNQFSLLCWERM